VLVNRVSDNRGRESACGGRDSDYRDCDSAYIGLQTVKNDCRVATVASYLLTHSYYGKTLFIQKSGEDMLENPPSCFTLARQR
jgi:hypothetical protein